jgi:hypothetical protein
MPKMRRPPLMWSSIETCSTTRSGSCHGSTTTIEPTEMRVVRAATHVRNCSTSGHMV